MKITKTSIKTLIGNGQLKEAIDNTQEYAKYCKLPTIVNSVITLKGEFVQIHKKNIAGAVSTETYLNMYNQITFKLLEWVDRLPNHPEQARKMRKPLSNITFKNRIFNFLLITKTLVFGLLFYHWSTGGFNNDQFLATVTLQIPIFAAYFSVMQDYFHRQRNGGTQPPSYISGPLVNLSLWLFLIYTLTLFFLIKMKVEGVISFVQMNLWIALSESILGGYIGKIVLSFFKKEN